MIKVLSKSGNLANLLRTTTSVGGSNIVPPPPAVPDKETPKFPIQRVTVTAYTSACAIPTRKMTVISGPSAKTSVRFGHTDVKVPDFSHYRRSSTKDPNVNNRDAQDVQRFYNGICVAVGGAATVYGAKCCIVSFLNTMAPAADVMALAKLEVKTSDIPEGKNITVKWRGKPLFIRHRTDAEIAKEAQVDLSTLRDPQHDNQRTKNPKWLVVIGVCTHLGCVPISHQGDWNGYYCPCHGSHYDVSGRIRKGPAPLNLEVPPYEFSEDILIVG